MRFELTTPTLARLCSTPELRPHPGVGRLVPAAFEIGVIAHWGGECNRDLRVGGLNNSRAVGEPAPGAVLGFGQGLAQGPVEDIGPASCIGPAGPVEPAPVNPFSDHLCLGDRSMSDADRPSPEPASRAPDRSPPDEVADLAGHASREDLMARLERLGIETVTHDHPAIFTVEQGAEHKKRWPGGHSKNLFLKDKKGTILLISAKDDTEVPLRGLHRHLDCGRLSFGSPDLLFEVLGVRPGSVTAFALINDRERRVRFHLDARLLEHDRVYFHPLENTASTGIRPADLLTFIRDCGHEPGIVDFAALGGDP